MLVAVLASAPAARAETLALVAPDPAWRAAVETALEPWGLRVETVEDAGAHETSSARGAQVCARTGAAAVAWLAPDPGGGSVLWVYDAGARAAEGHWVAAVAPLDAPTAAALALSLKTRLRHSSIGPDAPAPRARGPAPPAAPPPAPPAGARDAFTIELATGARFLATAPDHAEQRVALAGAFWPAALGRHLGIGGRLASGLGVEHRDATMDVRLVDTALEARLEARWDPIPELELRAGAGGGIHLTHLGGELLGSQHGVDVWRVVPAVSADVAIGARPTPRLWIGVRLGIDVPLLVQRYRVAGVDRLALSRHALGALLALELDLF